MFFSLEAGEELWRWHELIHLLYPKIFPLSSLPSLDTHDGAHLCHTFWLSYSISYKLFKKGWQETSSRKSLNCNKKEPVFSPLPISSHTCIPNKIDHPHIMHRKKWHLAAKSWDWNRMNTGTIDMGTLYRTPSPLCRLCPIRNCWQRRPRWRTNCGERDQIVFLTFTTIILKKALSTIHEVTGKSFVRAIYPCMIYLWQDLALKVFTKTKWKKNYNPPNVKKKRDI
jgi:hypothetical protein